MKIDTLTCTHFGCFRQVEIALDRPIAFFLARNGAGKSTLRRAVELVLRGETADLQGSAVPVSSLIRTGESLGSVRGQVHPTAGAKAVDVWRRITPKGTETKINGHEAGKAMLDLYTPPGMADPDAVLRIACNVGGFFDMAQGAAKAAGRQKELLVQLVDQSVPPAALEGLPLEAVGISAPATLGALTTAYDTVYQRRRDVGRDLTAAKRDAQGTAHVDLEGAPPDVGAIQGKLRELQDELERLTREHGQVLGERATLEQRRTELATQVDQAATRLQELGPLDKAKKAVSEAERSLASAKKDAAAAETAATAHTTKRDRLSGIRTRRGHLGKLGEVCVISEEIPCPLTTEARGGMLATWDQSIATLEAEVAAYTPAPRPNIPAFEARVVEAQRRVESIESLSGTHAAARGEHDAAVGRLRTLDTTAAEASVSALRQRVERGQQNLAEASRQLQERERAAADRARRTRLEAEHTALERLVEAFGPKGTSERLLVERLGALLDRVNEIMGHFGLRLTIQADPWSVLLNGLPPTLMAESELYRAGVAFQVALAEASGARLVVLDRFDLLDRENRQRCFGVLSMAILKGWAEQCLVFATYTTPEAPAGPFPDGVAAYLITAGEQGSTVARIGGAAAAA